MIAQTLFNFYFSPTYISSSYAGYVASSFAKQVTEIKNRDLTGPDNSCGSDMFCGLLTPDETAEKELSLTAGAKDIAIFSAPVYGGRIPSLAVERFHQIKGNNTPAIAIVTYGNREYEDALLELCDLMQERGFKVIAAAAFIGRHSLLPHIAINRPDGVDRDAARNFGKNVLEKLLRGEQASLETLHVKGARPYRDYTPGSLVPVADDNCNSCQFCVRRCPVQAIKPETPKQTESNCIFCGRCLKICPQKARQIPPAAFSAMREKLDPLCTEHKKAELFL